MMGDMCRKIEGRSEIRKISIYIGNRFFFTPRYFPPNPASFGFRCNNPLGWAACRGGCLCSRVVSVWLFLYCSVRRNTSRCQIALVSLRPCCIISHSQLWHLKHWLPPSGKKTTLTSNNTTLHPRCCPLSLVSPWPHWYLEQTRASSAWYRLKSTNQ